MSGNILALLEGMTAAASDVVAAKLWCWLLVVEEGLNKECDDCMLFPPPPVNDGGDDVMDEAPGKVWKETKRR